MRTGILSHGLQQGRRFLRSLRAPGAWGRCVALFVVLSLCACSKFVPLQANLSDADANEIILTLNRIGIDSEKQRAKEGVTVLVAETDLSRATEALDGAGLPRRSLARLGDVFKKQGMISSPMEERVRYLHGLSEELGFTLQQFDHVISARVHVVLPERVAPGEPIQPSSAAVFIKYRPPLDEDAIVPRVRRLVASSIPGLSGEEGGNKVTVVMTASDAPAPAIEWRTIGPFKVQEGSAGAVQFTLLAVLVLALLLLGMTVLWAAGRYPKVRAWLQRYAAMAGRLKLKKRGEAKPGT